MSDGLAVLLIIVVVLFFFSWVGGWFSPRKENQVSVEWRAQHREDGDSHIYYRDEDGQLKHYWDGCSDCVGAEANEMYKQGIKIEEVILGSRTSGDLSW